MTMNVYGCEEERTVTTRGDTSGGGCFGNVSLVTPESPVRGGGLGVAQKALRMHHPGFLI